MTVYCRVRGCTRVADYELYNKPVCNIHGFMIRDLKSKNPQAFINWKRFTNNGRRRKY